MTLGGTMLSHGQKVLLLVTFVDGQNAYRREWDIAHIGVENTITP